MRLCAGADGEVHHEASSCLGLRAQLLTNTLIDIRPSLPALSVTRNSSACQPFAIVRVFQPPLIRKVVAVRLSLKTLLPSTEKRASTTWPFESVPVPQRC